jgi:CubicO group peptidase (beta-lactamase class C family)
VYVRARFPIAADHRFPTEAGDGTMRIARSLLPITVLAFLPAAALAQPDGAALARVDSIFQRWNSKEAPGCAVAGARNGQPFFSRAYGMADLEHDVPNTPTTIFEAGSVSKQFTAAAIVLLAQEGKLSLEDDIRKYLPEIPDYGTPITIRHMMTHTSGFRDWGSVAGISGWPRTSRVHTHAHVLDIVSRQRALNFKPGDQYNYSNTNFNLQAIIVDRVSGMPFAEFTKKRLFEPLGMTSTSWRDDYTRIVKGRAVAYAGEQNGFSTDMPFENVHGNGGLLTTVGDLLIWTQNLETGKLGGPSFLEMMHRRGVLNNGDTITYASGLMVGRYNNTPEVSHTGSTAGYRAFLARYPQQKLSFALLCNIGTVNPGGVGHQVADVFLGTAGAAVAQGGQRGGRGGGAGQRGAGANAYTPTAAELASYAGEYYSPDAETTLTVVVEGNQVIARRRPATRIELRPTAQDQFSGQGGLGTVRFIRDAGGRVTQLSVRQDRVFDLRFDRVTR